MKRHAVRTTVLVAAALFSCAVPAIASADVSFTGAFASSGRACQGGLHVRTKTLDWITTYQICKVMPYEVLERDLSSSPQRIVFRIKKRTRQCSMEVLVLSQANPRIGQWDAAAYPSLVAYEKRKEPGWFGSLEPSRQPLTCMMFEFEPPLIK